MMFHVTAEQNNKKKFQFLVTKNYFLFLHIYKNACFRMPSRNCLSNSKTNTITLFCLFNYNIAVICVLFTYLNNEKNDNAIYNSNIMWCCHFVRTKHQFIQSVKLLSTFLRMFYCRTVSVINYVVFYSEMSCFYYKKEVKIVFGTHTHSTHVRHFPRLEQN